MNFKIKTLLVMIGVVLFWVLEGLMGESVNPLFKQVNIISNSEYDVVYQYSNDVNLDDSFYDLSRVMRFSRGITGKAEILMQKEVQYSLVTPFVLSRLASDEVIVSENFLKNNNLVIGDNVYLDNPIYDGTFEFRIVDSIPEVYGYYEKTLDPNMCVMIVGYDSVIVENNNLNSVVFCKNDYSIGQSGIALIETITKKAILEENTYNRNRQILYIVGFMLLLELLLFIAYFLFGSSRLRKKIIEGSSSKLINMYICKSYYLPLCLSLILSAVLYEISLLFKGSYIIAWPMVIAGIQLLVGLLLFVVYRTCVRRQI